MNQTTLTERLLSLTQAIEHASAMAPPPAMPLKTNRGRQLKLIFILGLAKKGKRMHIAGCRSPAPWLLHRELPIDVKTTCPTAKPKLATVRLDR